MRIELTRVCSLNVFHLVIGLYRGFPFFLECVYRNLLHPFLILDMFFFVVGMCVVLKWFRILQTVIFPLCACECVFRVFFVCAIKKIQMSPKYRMRPNSSQTKNKQNNNEVNTFFGKSWNINQKEKQQNVTAHKNKNKP